MLKKSIMFDLWPVLQQDACCAEKLRNALSVTDASKKLLFLVSDGVWGSKGVHRTYLDIHC
jgi:hypothetical protein